MLVPCSMQLDKERNATSTPEGQAGVLVVHKHHLLVRCSHWLNVPIPSGPHPEWCVHLLGISGLSAQTRSTERECRSSRGHRYLDMRACTRAAPIQQSA